MKQDTTGQRLSIMNQLCLLEDPPTPTNSQRCFTAGFFLQHPKTLRGHCSGDAGNQLNGHLPLLPNIGLEGEVPTTGVRPFKL